MRISFDVRVALTVLVWFGAPTLCSAQGYTISTFAGGGSLGSPYGDGGPAVGAPMSGPIGLAVDPAGNLYIVDGGFCVVRKVTPAGIISTVAGVTQSGGSNCGYSGDGGPATKAMLGNPFSVAADSSGNLYLAEPLNFRVRKIDRNGIISTIAGTGAGGGGVAQGDGGPATQAPLDPPYGVAVDAAGNVYITESFFVRKVTPGGIISTVAAGLQLPTAANPALTLLYSPYGITVDGAGNVYFSDKLKNTIRRISLDGTVSTVAGSGAGSFQGDGGPATAAGFFQPFGLAVDGSGNIFIADTGDNRVRMVNTSGTITTIAGTGELGTSGDGGPGTSAALYKPSGIALGAGGVVYVSDLSEGNLIENARVRKLTPAVAVNTLPSIKSSGVVSASAFGQFASVAPGSWIEIYGSNLASTTRSWAGADFSGSNAPTSLDGTKVTIGGQSAFIDYISPVQVNAQAPSNIGLGPQQIVVTTPSGSSAAFPITVNATQPGLLAPSSFNVAGTQYAAALFSDGTTFVLPAGAIPGLPSRRAKPGDTITFYGIGFGSVVPNIPAGQIVQQGNMLASSLQINFGTTPGTITYAGLAPSAVGLYQFNVVVPNIVGSDAVPVTFTLGGAAGSQALYLSVQNGN